MKQLPSTREELQSAVIDIRSKGATPDQIQAFVNAVKAKRPDVDFTKPIYQTQIETETDPIKKAAMMRAAPKYGETTISEDTTDYGSAAAMRAGSQLRSQQATEALRGGDIKGWLGGMTESFMRQMGSTGKDIQEKVVEPVAGAAITGVKKAVEYSPIGAAERAISAGMEGKPLEAFGEIAKSPLGPLEAVTDALGITSSEDVKAQEERIAGAAKKVADVTGATDAIKNIMSWYDNLDPDQKINANALLSIAETAGDIAGIVSVAKPTIEAGKIVKETITDAFKDIGKVSQKAVDDAIEEGVMKGIKPAFAGSKRSIAGMNQYKKDANQAVKAIVNNKQNLKITDEFGEELVDKVPSTLAQFEQSIDQTKKNIFDKYNTLAKEASKEGAEVPLEKIAKELDSIANNKVILTQDPKAAKYASDLAERYRQAASYSAEESQEAIKSLNNKLSAFYRNPDAGNTIQNGIDAMIANNLRKDTDDIIENTLGKAGYQDLKSQYGSLKSIEKDVARRALIEARKANKGLVDFSDIFSAGDVVMGLMSGQPGQVAKGAVQKGIALYYKHLNSPNRAIKNMFNKIEEAVTKGVKKPPSFKAAGAAIVPDEIVERESIKMANNPEFFENTINNHVKKTNIINTDDFRNYFTKAGYDGNNSGAVQEAASKMSKEAWRRALNEYDGNATFLAGGSGAGKTTAIQNTTIDLGKNPILDGNLSSLNTFNKRYNEVKNAGKELDNIIYVYRDPMDAWENGVIARMLGSREEGRIVPLSEFAKNTRGAWDTIQDLYVKGFSDKIKLVDNSLGKGKSIKVNIEDIIKKNVPSVDEIKKQGSNIVNKLYEQGKITERQKEYLLK